MAKDILGDVETHFWLTRSVARCMNISLSEAMVEGRLTPDHYAEMVTRCRASQCSGQCAIWLSEQQTEASAAPEFCANSDLLNGLKA
ncbi:DUF6455 family protein [Ruegeria atlantica]|uniref:DUF6455 family protein n=1 Tax=Ruegeria atlantica TaxID=81569 RepID=UPI00147BB3B0|nr:DUF6455 family protein [Ruegeria atlantica]